MNTTHYRTGTVEQITTGSYRAILHDGTVLGLFQYEADAVEALAR